MKNRKCSDNQSERFPRPIHLMLQENTATVPMRHEKHHIPTNCWSGQARSMSSIALLRLVCQRRKATLMSKSILKNKANVTSFHEREDRQETLLADPFTHVFHTAEKPFCSDRQCECHQNQTQIAWLLEAVWEGEMTLYEAVNYADGKNL